MRSLTNKFIVLLLTLTCFSYSFPNSISFLFFIVPSPSSALEAVPLSFSTNAQQYGSLMRSGELPNLVTTTSPLSSPSEGPSPGFLLVKEEPMIEDIFCTIPNSQDVLGDLDSLEDFLQMQTDFKIEPTEPVELNGTEMPMMEPWTWDKPLSSVNMDFDFDSKYSSIEAGAVINSVDPHLVVRAGPHYGLIDENANTGFLLKNESRLGFNL